MSRTPEELAEIRRQNGRKSRGPKTEEGKKRSRLNALKHGLCAGLAALQVEDQAAIDSRLQEWDDFYRPESPAARQFLIDCVRATVLSDRIHRGHDAMLLQQVRVAQIRITDERAYKLEKLTAQFYNQPVETLPELRKTADGCDWVAVRWEDLRDKLKTRGYWDRSEIELAHKLAGYSASLSLAAVSYVPAMIRLLATALAPDAKNQLAHLYKTVRLQPTLVELWPAHQPPTREEALSSLLNFIDDQCSPLRERERFLRETIEGPELETAIDRACVLEDPDQARLFLRYQAEARSSFHRAYAAFTKALKEAPAEVAVEDDIMEVAPPQQLPAAPLTEHGSRNEPAPAPEPSRNEPARAVVSPPEPSRNEPAPVALPDSRNEPGLVERLRALAMS